MKKVILVFILVLFPMANTDIKQNDYKRNCLVIIQMSLN